MEEKTITPAQEFTSCAITVRLVYDQMMQTCLLNVNKIRCTCCSSIKFELEFKSSLLQIVSTLSVPKASDETQV